MFLRDLKTARIKTDLLFVLSVEYFGVRDVGRTGEQSLFMHEIMGIM